MSANLISPETHALKTIEFVRNRTDSVVLFYSGGGKDSLALLDMLTRQFKTVHCVFMYFVKDLDHQKPFLTLLKRYPNAILHQYPHWALADFFREGEGINVQYEVPKIKLKDIEADITRKTGATWFCYGWKMSDGMMRRIILGRYHFSSISLETKHFYPLALWKKNDVLFYNKQHHLPTPVQYTTGNSQGLDLLPQPLIWVRDNWPNDYQRILQQFPRAEGIVLRYEQQEEIRRQQPIVLSEVSGAAARFEKELSDRDTGKIPSKDKKAAAAARAARKAAAAQSKASKFRP